MKPSQNLSKPIRILVSEESEIFRVVIALIQEKIAGPDVMVESIAPRHTGVGDLIEIAEREDFDLAILLLNNIYYSPDEPDGLADEHLALVRKMVESFRKPVIGLYGWPRCAEHALRVVEAGAAAAFQVPYGIEELKRAIKSCLSSQAGS